MTDKELYVAFLGGDTKAFESLVLRHRHQLVYFIMQYTKNFDLAEDIAQDVFAYFYIEPESYNSDYNFKTFLYTVAKRRAIDLIRKENRFKADSIDDDNNDIEDTTSLENIIFAREDVRKLRQALKQIKKEYAEILILTQIDGLSMNETAKILNKSLASTKVLLHRARKSLKDKMV